MTLRVIKRVTTKVEEILADNGKDHGGQAEALLEVDGGHRHGEVDDDIVVEAPRGGPRAGRAKLALPPMLRTRARTNRAADTEDAGDPAHAQQEDDGRHGDDGGDVVEAARGGARVGRTKPAQPPLSRTRGRNER